MSIGDLNLPHISSQGGILVAIHAVEALIKADRLGVNVKFLLEGQVSEGGRCFNDPAAACLSITCGHLSLIPLSLGGNHESQHQGLPRLPQIIASGRPVPLSGWKTGDVYIG